MSIQCEKRIDFNVVLELRMEYATAIHGSSTTPNPVFSRAGSVVHLINILKAGEVQSEE
jgi:hypothetical protein